MHAGIILRMYSPNRHQSIELFELNPFPNNLEGFRYPRNVRQHSPLYILFIAGRASMYVPTLVYNWGCDARMKELVACMYMKLPLTY